MCVCVCVCEREREREREREMPRNMPQSSSQESEIIRESPKEPQYDYDLFVIGGGSGGVRGSRTASQTGAKVTSVFV